MRSFIIAILIAIMLALAFALVLNSAQETAEMAFTTESVRLNAASPVLSSKEKTDVSYLVNGGFVILGALIAAVAGYVGANQQRRCKSRHLTTRVRRSVGASNKRGIRKNTKWRWRYAEKQNA